MIILNFIIFRKTENGDSYSTFHNLCDNQGTTLVLTKSVEGFVIGGYTQLDWDNQTEGWKKDDDTFLFSLTNNKIFRKTSKNSYSIYCSKNLGPWFPFIGFRASGKKNMNQGEYQFSSSNYFKDYNDIIPNDGKGKFFDVKEVEIYKISYI